MNLILVEVDLPKTSPPSSALRAQNAELKQKFDVYGFLTLVLLNGQGNEIARNAGYLPGGPTAFIDWIWQAVE